MFENKNKMYKISEEDQFDSNEKLINQMEIEILAASILQMIKKVILIVNKIVKVKKLEEAKKNIKSLNELFKEGKVQKDMNFWMSTNFDFSSVLLKNTRKDSLSYLEKSLY